MFDKKKMGASLVDFLPAMEKLNTIIEIFKDEKYQVSCNAGITRI